jgi:hypothetical protein
MDEEQRKKNLKAMRQALKEARAQRKEDMRELGDRMYDEIYELHYSDPRTYTSNGLDDVMHLASNRKLLHEVRAENRYGEQSKGVLAIKEREEYQKRPSVRALKKTRDAGGRSM